jgi:hypothetical protein
MAPTSQQQSLEEDLLLKQFLAVSSAHAETIRARYSVETEMVSKGQQASLDLVDRKFTKAIAGFKEIIASNAPLETKATLGLLIAYLSMEDYDTALRIWRSELSDVPYGIAIFQLDRCGESNRNIIIYKLVEMELRSHSKDEGSAAGEVEDIIDMIVPYARDLVPDLLPVIGMRWYRALQNISGDVAAAQVERIGDAIPEMDTREIAKFCWFPPMDSWVVDDQCELSFYAPDGRTLSVTTGAIRRWVQAQRPR